MLTKAKIDMVEGGRFCSSPNGINFIVVKSYDFFPSRIENMHDPIINPIL